MCEYVLLSKILLVSEDEVRLLWKHLNRSCGRRYSWSFHSCNELLISTHGTRHWNYTWLSKLHTADCRMRLNIMHLQMCTSLLVSWPDSVVSHFQTSIIASIVVEEAFQKLQARFHEDYLVGGLTEYNMTCEKSSNCWRHNLQICIPLFVLQKRSMRITENLFTTCKHTNWLIHC